MKRDDLTIQGDIAFQGAYGAFSDQMARQIFPERRTHPCETFEEALEAVRTEKAAYGVIPVDNSLAGRVADVHALLPKAGLHIVGEGYLPIAMCLMGQGDIKDIKEVHSHIHALPQCRDFIKQYGFKTFVHADTAGAAKMVAEKGDASIAAIAPKIAASIYELNILAENVQDSDHNYTRFLVLSREAVTPPPSIPCLTTLLFKVKDIPSALYVALGAFANNTIQLTKLESYRDLYFNTAAFLCDVEAHPADPAFQRALAQLGLYSDSVTILGTYPKASLPIKE